MIYIVQHPMNGRLLMSDRRTFSLPGSSGEVWSTANEDEARRVAEVVGGKAVAVAEPSSAPPLAKRRPGASPPAGKVST